MSSHMRACLRCRRKKIRCDGARPTCYHCEKTGVPDNCIYGGESKFHGAQLLEDKINQLKARIALLEGNTSGPVLLHDPYAPFHERQHQGQLGSRDRNRQQIPPNTIQALTHCFSGVASQAGFFLHAPRFCQRVIPLPATSLPKHASALLNAVCLLGAYVSNDARLQGLQGDFLAFTLEDLSATLLDLSPPAIMDLLQTEILLAIYLFSSNRQVEGIYHMDAASAMVLASRLHEVGGARQFQPQDAQLSSYQLPSAADRIEEEERVNALWATLVLDKCWSPILGRTPILVDVTLDAEPPATPVSGLASLEAEINQTKTQFGARTSNFEQDPLKLHAQAASIYCSATQTSARFLNDPVAYLRGSAELADRITRFQQALQPLNAIHPARQDLVTRLLLVHTLYNCAIIQLYKPLDLQRGNTIPVDSKAYAAAWSASSVLSQIDISTLKFVDPPIGFLLVSVADVLLSALRLLRLEPRTSTLANPNEQGILAALTQIRYALTTWGEGNVYIKSQLLLLRKMLEVI